MPFVIALIAAVFGFIGRIDPIRGCPGLFRRRQAVLYWTNCPQQMIAGDHQKNGLARHEG